MLMSQTINFGAAITLLESRKMGKLVNDEIRVNLGNRFFFFIRFIRRGPLAEEI